jgi:hypothetical protein
MRVLETLAAKDRVRAVPFEQKTKSSN